MRILVFALSTFAGAIALISCTKRVERSAPLSPVREIVGTVTDSNTARLIPWATIRVSRDRARKCRLPADQAFLVDSLGSFRLQLADGEHYVCALALGYAPRSILIVLSRDSTRLVVLRLPQEPVYLGN